MVKSLRKKSNNINCKYGNRNDGYCKKKIGSNSRRKYSLRKSRHRLHRKSRRKSPLRKSPLRRARHKSHRKSPLRRSHRKSPLRRSHRKSPLRRSRRKSPLRKSPRRKSPRRKSPRRKSPRRKSPRRKSRSKFKKYSRARGKSRGKSRGNKVHSGAVINCNELIGPISTNVFVDPVITSDGMTYERESIQRWIDERIRNGQDPTSPLTNLRLDNINLTPNKYVRQLLESEYNRKTLAQRCVEKQYNEAQKRAKKTNSGNHSETVDAYNARRTRFEALQSTERDLEIAAAAAIVAEETATAAATEAAADAYHASIQSLHDARFRADARRQEVHQQILEISPDSNPVNIDSPTVLIESAAAERFGAALQAVLASAEEPQTTLASFVEVEEARRAALEERVQMARYGTPPILIATQEIAEWTERMARAAQRVRNQWVRYYIGGRGQGSFELTLRVPEIVEIKAMEWALDERTVAIMTDQATQLAIAGGARPREVNRLANEAARVTVDEIINIRRLEKEVFKTKAVVLSGLTNMQGEARAAEREAERESSIMAPVRQQALESSLLNVEEIIELNASEARRLQNEESST